VQFVIPSLRVRLIKWGKKKKEKEKKGERKTNNRVWERCIGFIDKIISVESNFQIKFTP